LQRLALSAVNASDMTIQTYYSFGPINHNKLGVSNCSCSKFKKWNSKAIKVCKRADKSRTLDDFTNSEPSEPWISIPFQLL
jgi:hypothetical protein